MDSTEAPPEGRRLALSPSRAVDFKTCPLLYRFRAIDRLSEPPSPAAARGTLVHAVLEDLFGNPVADRTEAAAVDSVATVWERLCHAEPELATVVGGGLDAWLGAAAELVRAYFTLENPAAFDPQARELAVEISVPGGHGQVVPLKGFIDRLDVAPTGEVRIVDYKTGFSPSELHEVGALYQLKFYALMIFRIRGVLPTELKLIYLGDATSLVYRPTVTELVAFERGLAALWETIGTAVRTGDFPARPSGACRWCKHQSLCPGFGGTPPPYPAITWLTAPATKGTPTDDTD